MTTVIQTKSPIVIAEDDEDDYLLILEALQEAGVGSEIKWVKDGEELMAYLDELGGAQDTLVSPCPCLILLDWNMPKKDGREALQEIKKNKKFRKIPVVIFTTSKSDADIHHSYELGVNSFIQKPVRFHEFVEIARVLSQYWFSFVQLPH